MRAIILAAGEGSRLRPFTSSKPKPMLRVANKPIAQHAVEALVANGVKDVTFVLGYQRQKVQQHFGDGARFGAKISYAFQEALLGTGNAFAMAPKPTGPCLVLGGDNVIDASLVKSILDAPGEGPAMAVHRSDAPSRYGVVTLEGSRVARIVEKPSIPRSEWVNTGVYRLLPESHDLARQLAASGAVGLPDVVQARIDGGAAVEAVKSADLWADAVYPWDLLRLHAEVLRRHHLAPPKLPGVHADHGVLVGQEAVIGGGTVLGAGTCIGNNVEIHPGCILENCVVYDDARIAAGSVLRNSIVGEGTQLGERTTAISGACSIRTSDGWHDLPDFGSILGEDARVGGAVTFLPGTVLGNRARVAHGRTVHGSIEDDSVAV